MMMKLRTAVASPSSSTQKQHNGAIKEAREGTERTVDESESSSVEESSVEEVTGLSGIFDNDDDSNSASTSSSSNDDDDSDNGSLHDDLVVVSSEYLTAAAVAGESHNSSSNMNHNLGSLSFLNRSVAFCSLDEEEDSHNGCDPQQQQQRQQQQPLREVSVWHTSNGDISIESQLSNGGCGVAAVPPTTVVAAQRSDSYLSLSSSFSKTPPQRRSLTRTRSDHHSIQALVQVQDSAKSVLSQDAESLSSSSTSNTAASPSNHLSMPPSRPLLRKSRLLRSDQRPSLSSRTTTADATAIAASSEQQERSIPLRSSAPNVLGSRRSEL